MISEKITLILIHSAKSPPRTISVGRNRLVFLLASLAIFAGFSLFSGFQTFTGAIKREKLGTLEHENGLLRAELAKLGTKVAEIEQNMSGRVEFEERMRVLADLEPLHDDVWDVGVGGPEAAEPAYGASGAELKSVSADIARLARQLKLQRHSFDQILSELQGKADELKRMPSIRPVEGGYVSSYFGRRRDPFTGRVGRHEGIDITARKGTKVVATADGQVRFAAYDSGYGYTVEIDHGNGVVSRYAHNAKMAVKKGDQVSRGEVIAYVGNSGRSTAPHLHYEILVAGVAQNPLKYILPSDVVVD